MIEYGFPNLRCQLTHDFIPHSTYKCRFKQSLVVYNKWTCHFSLHGCGQSGTCMPLNAINKFGLGILKEITEHNQSSTRVKGVWELVIMFYPCRCNIIYKFKALSTSESVMSNNHLEKLRK